MSGAKRANLVHQKGVGSQRKWRCAVRSAGEVGSPVGNQMTELTLLTRWNVCSSPLSSLHLMSLSNSNEIPADRKFSALVLTSASLAGLPLPSQLTSLLNAWRKQYLNDPVSCWLNVMHFWLHTRISCHLGWSVCNVGRYGVF